MSRKQVKKKTTLRKKIRTALKLQKWKNLFSKKILSNHALPIIRGVESKLLSLKNKLESPEA